MMCSATRLHRTHLCCRFWNLGKNNLSHPLYAEYSPPLAQSESINCSKAGQTRASNYFPAAQITSVNSVSLISVVELAMLLDLHDVRRAFEEDEFYPLFQPLVNLSSGQLVGFEALARWNHARLGAISPDAFIPVVQKSGYINTLTRKLLEKTFAAASLLPVSLRLSINLFSMQLMDEMLPGQIAAVAERGGFPLDRLSVEMTERALLNHLSCAEAVAAELKNLHCRLSLDNFGTGQSSLIHLHALPFDEVKIDRSLIHAMTQSRATRIIVAAVVGLGRDLGLETVAEGVETEEEAGILREMRCDLAQGWHFGRPAAADEIPRMVSAAACNRAAIDLAEQDAMAAAV